MPLPLLTLLTDFGDADVYVGMLKGAILSRLPEIHLVDLTHRLPPNRTGAFASALFLRRVYAYYPAGTLHLIGLDSSCSGAPAQPPRRALLAAAGGQYFLAADNGVLALMLSRETETAARAGTPPPAVYAVPVTQPTTFLARDVLAPLAEQLARGAAASTLGQPVEDWQRLSLPHPQPIPSGGVQGEVLHVDPFGNLLTNVTPADMPRSAPGSEPRLEVAGQIISCWANDYASAPPAELFLIWGAEGWLEISLRQASAAERLQAGIGTPVRMR